MDQFSQSVNNDPALLGNRVGSDVRFGRLVQEYVDLKKEELIGGREVDFGKLFDAIEKELSTRVGGEFPAKSFSDFINGISQPEDSQFSDGKWSVHTKNGNLHITGPDVEHKLSTGSSTSRV